MKILARSMMLSLGLLAATSAFARSDVRDGNALTACFIGATGEVLSHGPLDEKWLGMLPLYLVRVVRIHRAKCFAQQLTQSRHAVRSEFSRA